MIGDEIQDDNAALNNLFILSFYWLQVEVI